MERTPCGFLRTRASVGGTDKSGGAMASGWPVGGSPSAADEGGRRFDSWKEIAAYFGRDVRTVRRWETNEALPVHRHLHGSRGSVYAYQHELDHWRVRRSLPGGADPPCPSAVTAPFCGFARRGTGNDADR